MRPGFPKSITTRKIRRGHYMIERADGRRFEAVRGVGHWWINAAWTVGTLRAAQYAIRHGFTAGDQGTTEQAADRP